MDLSDLGDSDQGARVDRIQDRGGRTRSGPDSHLFDPNFAGHMHDFYHVIYGFQQTLLDFTQHLPVGDHNLYIYIYIISMFP